MSKQVAWKPVLTGDEAARARAIAEEIAEAIVAPSEKAERGDPFKILLDIYLATTLSSDRHAERAVAVYENFIEHHIPYPSRGLFGGLSGVGWVGEHMTKELSEWLETEDDDPYESLDNRLRELAPGRKGYYDLISGVVGMAEYAAVRIERPSARELMAAVVDELEQTCEHVDAGTTWYTPPEILPEHQLKDAPQGYYNLGVAHGVPGVAVALARALQAGVRVEKARPMLDGLMQWMMSQQSEGGVGARFTSWVVPGQKSAGGSREAWCYGGLGLSVSLLLVARLTGNALWEERAREYARLEAQRPSEHSGIKDTCLCHGACGNGHLYNRLYQATGEEIFLDRARAYFRQTLEAYKPGVGHGGFLFWCPDPPNMDLDWRPNSTFLNGSAGVALGLLAASSEVEPRWDRLLLADVT